MPFEPGQSGNPGGRPKRDTSLTGILRKELNKKGADKVAKKTRIVGKLIELAEAGDIPALKYLWDRVDGKARETMEITTSGELDAKLTTILGRKA
ncbi:hypothetical protein FACS1894141_0420 [Spirochaetia bacterium]|nr:hypothetical protein FACS1894141_0420 [Spirochaetia bacterium]